MMFKALQIEACIVIPTQPPISIEACRRVLAKNNDGASSSTVNLRLSPIRKLAREMSDNGMLEPATAAAIERVPGVEKRGNRVGKWLMKEQANSLLTAPDPKTLTGLRDRAILALLLGCGLRRAELLRINFEDLQQREGRWVLPDMEGKGGRVRTVTVSAGVKTRIDAWLKASGTTKDRLFGPVSKAGELAADGDPGREGSLATGDAVCQSIRPRQARAA